MGGVFSGRDVADLASVGARAVALGTVLFVDPWAAPRIRSELAHELTAAVTDRQPIEHGSVSSPTL